MSHYGLYAISVDDDDDDSDDKGKEHPKLKAPTKKKTPKKPPKEEDGTCFTQIAFIFFSSACWRTHDLFAH